MSVLCVDVMVHLAPKRADLEAANLGFFTSGGSNPRSLKVVLAMANVCQSRSSIRIPFSITEIS